MRDGRDHVGEDAQAATHLVGRVEQRLLVLLVVLVVREGLALHQGQQPHQVAEDATGLSAHQLRHVRVLLLRHDGRARAEAVGQLDEAELRGGPEDQLFGEAREVHHQNARRGGELDREVAIRDGVQRVLRRAVEAEQLGRVVAVDRVGRAGERCGAQRHDVEAARAVGEATVVAPEHLQPGHQVVPERDRLGGLEMREARHDRVGLALGEVEERQLEAAQLRADRGQLVAQPQPHVGRDLIVAGAPGVKLLAGDADIGGERRLDVHVDVLEPDLPREVAPLDALANSGQPCDDEVAVGLAEDSLAGEHAGVGDRALDVVAVQTLVELDGGGEGLHEGVGGLAESAGPEFVAAHRGGFPG